MTPVVGPSIRPFICLYVGGLRCKFATVTDGPESSAVGESVERGGDGEEDEEREAVDESTESL